MFGTTTNGGAYSNNGTVFEIASGTTTAVTVASFNGANGTDPVSGVIFDSSGDLLGTTYGGGQFGYGTVYEIPRGTSGIIAIASFNIADGSRPVASVTLDSSGTLYGTTGLGGASQAGNVFVLSPATTLAFLQQPAGAQAGPALAPVMVAVEDPFGNVVTGDSSAITLSLSGGLFSNDNDTVTLLASNGIATFSGLEIAPGTYTLIASDGALAAATSTSFTLAPTSAVVGEVFNDGNMNGVLDGGDAGLPDVTVTLTPIGTMALPVTIATIDDGTYRFANVLPGTYSVTESLPDGYALTAPIGEAATVSVSPNQDAIGPMFGNVQLSAVTLGFGTLVALSQNYNKSGTFANGDLNGDGMVNFSDLVLLSQNYNQTLPSGAYNFSGMIATSQTLTSSSAQTTALPAPLSTAKAVTALAAISGTVFNDANGDSVRQSGDKGLSGRTVELEIAGKGTKGIRTTVTNSSGSFSFANLPAGNYVLIVPAPAGWKSTTAAASGDLLALKARTKKSGLLFGQQIIPPYTVTATRVTDPLDHTKDIVTFYVRNNGVGATAGTRDVLAVDAMLASPSGLLIRTYDGEGSGLLDDADFAGENATPTASYIRVGGTGFFVASTTPAARTDKYKDMQLVPSFEVAGTLFGGGVAANSAGGTRIAVSVVKKGGAVTLTGKIAAEKGMAVPVSLTST